MRVVLVTIVLFGLCYSQCTDCQCSCGDYCPQSAVTIQNAKYFNQKELQTRVAVVDTGFNANNLLLYGQLSDDDKGFKCNASSCVEVPIKSFNDTVNGHGTSVVTILIGQGNRKYFLTSDWNGYLSNCTLEYYDVDVGCRYISCLITALNKSATGSANVISLSQGSNSSKTNTDLYTAVSNAFSMGKLFVCSAGNYGPDYSTIGQPAFATIAIAVGAVEFPNLTQANYQSRGPTTYSVTKPDVQGISSICAGTTSELGVALFRGTSCAAPTVAGSAALLFAKLSKDITPPNGINGIVAAFLYMAGNNTKVTQSISSVNNVQGFGLISLPYIQTYREDYVGYTVVPPAGSDSWIEPLSFPKIQVGETVLLNLSCYIPVKDYTAIPNYNLQLYEYYDNRPYLVETSNVHNSAGGRIINYYYSNKHDATTILAAQVKREGQSGYVPQYYIAATIVRGVDPPSTGSLQVTTVLPWLLVVALNVF